MQLTIPEDTHMVVVDVDKVTRTATVVFEIGGVKCTCTGVPFERLKLADIN